MPDTIITVSTADLQCPTSPLRICSKPCTDWSEVPSIIVRMLKTFYSIEHADGLSAIQIGIPLRIAVVNLNRIPGEERIIINPELISVSGRIQSRKEGCLSLPNYSGPVSRRNKVTVRAFDIQGTEYVFTTTGYEAAVVQHELDHIDGILYWDRMAPGMYPQLRQPKP